jgi:hypothetical protein
VPCILAWQRDSTRWSWTSTTSDCGATGPKTNQRELDGLPARQIVLQLDHVSDDLLPRVAAFVRYLGTEREVAICGVAPGQIARLSSLGIDANSLLVGRWRQLGF